MKRNLIWLCATWLFWHFSSARVWKIAHKWAQLLTKSDLQTLCCVLPDWSMTTWAWRPSQTTSTACTTAGSSSGSGWRGNVTLVLYQSTGSQLCEIVVFLHYSCVKITNKTPAVIAYMTSCVSDIQQVATIVTDYGYIVQMAANVTK